jgi:hypothetical protein
LEVSLVESLEVCELSWVEEVFVVTEISDDIFDIPDEVSENLDVCAKLFLTDVEIVL